MNLPAGTKILVSGGAGFIGSNYIRSIIDKNYDIFVVDKLTYAGNKSNLADLIADSKIKFFHVDICDISEIENQIPDVDIVINFAAETHVDRSIEDSFNFVKTNVLGTQALLDYALRNKVSIFLQISTDEVYGSLLSGSWNESCNLEPNSPYSASKAAADLLALSYFKTHGMDIRITRCCNNYGPKQNPEKLIPKIILNSIKKQNVPIYGDGLNVREWIYVLDHCKAIDLVLIKGQAGEIYNVGSGIELNNLTLASKILSYTNTAENLIEFVQDRKGHDFRYSLDSSKIGNLGFVKDYDLEEGLLNTISWYKENPKYWVENEIHESNR